MCGYFAFLLLVVGNAAQAYDERLILLQAPWASVLGWDTTTTVPCSTWSGLVCGEDGTLSSV